MEAKIEEFIKIKQRRLFVKEYTLKFHLLSRYASNSVVDKKSMIRMLAFWLNKDLILESKIILLMKDMDTLRLIIYIK